MTAFRYQARDAEGGAATGMIEAASRQEALGALAARGLFPSSLEPTGGGNGNGGNGNGNGGSANGGSGRKRGNGAAVPARAPASLAAAMPAGAIRAPGSASPPAGGRISRKEISAFTRGMASLLSATIPIPAALRGLGQEEPNAALRGVLLDLDDAVRKGSSLSAAMSAHRKLFPTLYTSMIQVGEEAGALDRVMADLADLLEHEDEVRGEVIGAIAYPLFVLLMGGATTFILLAFVLPKLFGMLKGMIAVLPLPTRVLLGVSNFLQADWIWVLAGLVAMVLGLRWFSRTPSGALLLDGWKLRAPVIGPVFRASALGRFARTLGTLVRSGVSILPALEIVRSTIGNRVVERSIIQAAEETRGGDSLAAPLRKLGLFPSTVIQMISVGEETGRLDDMLLRIAAMEERRMRSYSRTLISLLAPAMILVVGALVGFIVIAILLPIFRMSQSIH